MDIDTLCISGGGLKGISFFGAIYHLLNVEYLVLDKIKTYIGSSVGAIISTLLVLGYTIDEMLDFILNFDFTILEPNIDCDNIFKNYGFCTNDKIILTMEHFIKTKINNINITFLELYKHTNKKLIITGTNITDMKLEYFDYINTPEMQVIDAIRISCCIPVIFSPIKYNDKYYIDGAVASNLPINNCNKNTTLGIIAKSKNINIDSIISVFYATINIMVNSQLKHDDYNILSIDDTNYTIGNFILDKEKKEKLFINGIETAKIHIKHNTIKNNNKETQTDFVDDIIKVEININL
jgi:predicted acylesterase/phospholipase RssA